MKKFVLLYQANAAAVKSMNSAPAAQREAGMKMWMAWQKKAGKAIVDFGMPVGHGLTVVKGKASKSTSRVGGYSILQAKSMKDVVKLLKDHPHTQHAGATIEVLEQLPMPGME